MKKEIFEKYLESVIKQMGVPREDLLSRTKKAHVVDARHILFYLCSIRPMKPSYIQHYMTEAGLKTSLSTVMHAIKRIEILVDPQSSSYDKDYEALISNLL
tara:strand:+ start:1570 stop:1872 length:303 start_codon:yes stop_codon:yes gene_type:complete